jgi:hypothetical protein
MLRYETAVPFTLTSTSCNPPPDWLPLPYTSEAFQSKPRVLSRVTNLTLLFHMAKSFHTRSVCDGTQY